MPVEDLIQLRGGTAAAWATADPVLGAREPGVETDTGRLKVGDGTSVWTALPYSDTGDDTPLVRLAAVDGATVTFTDEDGVLPRIPLASPGGAYAIVTVVCVTDDGKGAVQEAQALIYNPSGYTSEVLVGATTTTKVAGPFNFTDWMTVEVGFGGAVDGRQTLRVRVQNPDPDRPPLTWYGVLRWMTGP